MNTVVIFVYGTLRKGGRAENKLVDAEWLGSAIFRGRLYAVDWYPGVIEDPDGDVIHGDVFSVSETTLLRLDEYEGCDPASPKPHEYVRKECTVLLGSQKKNVQMWLYQSTVDEAKRISHGDWLRYLEEGW